MDNEGLPMFKAVDVVLNEFRSMGLDLGKIESESDYGKVVCNFLTLFLSKYKVKEFFGNEDEKTKIEMINQCLKQLNSKFFVVEKYSLKGFCFVVVYFLIEYDVVNDFIENVYRGFKKINLIKFVSEKLNF